jgi:D-alanine-D-alanine ligase
MRIGIVRTASSPCRCAESVSEGLTSLGHEFLIADSEEIELKASMLAETCDLVIDHTDTFRGRGIYRPFVRAMLESFGARVVGSDARACFLADNKAAAKSCLANAGIPVPPGIVVQSKSFDIPEWLRPPLILKPAYEHMSRGLRIVHTKQDAYSAAIQLLEPLCQPILIESYIPGRELAVSVIAGPEGLQVLPVLEWGIGSGDAAVLNEDFKLMDPANEMHKMLQADLPHDLNDELEAFARRAFHALGLRDYARFDVRLSSGGMPYFLEANTTPSLEPLEALATSAHWAGLGYAALVDRLLSAVRNRYALLSTTTGDLLHIQIPNGFIELEAVDGVPSPPPSTIELAGLLDVREGEEVLDLGCGSGLLSIAMAKFGARRVVATDLDPRALQATKQNARRNGVEDRIELRSGSWYEALKEGSSQAGPINRFDVIVATPPQTPGRQPFGPKYGGPDGTRHLFNILSGAPDFLKPDRGRLWLLAISLANPNELWKRLREWFSEAVLVRETERPFTGEEYEAIEKGLFDYLRSLRLSGISDFTEHENGQCSFRNLFIRAAKPKIQ